MQETWDVGSIPGLRRVPGGGHGNPLQYSFLENPMDRGAWWATVHGVTESRTCLEGLSAHAQNRKRAGTRFLLSPRKRVRMCSPGLVNQMLPLRSRRLEPLVQTGIQSSFRDTRGSWGGQRAAIVGGRNITRGQSTSWRQRASFPDSSSSWYGAGSFHASHIS